MAYSARSAASISSNASNKNTTAKRAPHVPYQDRQFQCTKQDCQHLFDTLEAMKLHKKHDPEHFYCKRCDFDAEDWEDLTKHKVDNMAPYIEGVKGHTKPLDDDLKHITCEFCGEDFKSFGGRKRHRQMNHPADQDINCPGCQAQFIRASHLMEHLEKGHCLVIPASHFNGALQHKYVVSQIMVAPHLAFKAPGMLDGRFPAARVTDGGETLDQDTGGVSLLDQQGEAQLGDYKPMKAEKNLINLNPEQKWPQLPGQSSANLEESFASMSFGSKDHSASKKNSGGVSCQEDDDSCANHHGSETMYSYPDSGLQSPSAASTTGQDDDDTASRSTPTPARMKTGGGVWSTNKTASALFPNVKAAPILRAKPGDWAAILAQHSAEAESNTGTDMLKIAWWNPSSKDYDIERFRHPVYEAFYCPFPSCEDNPLSGNSFDSQSDIENHIRYCHTRTKFRCEGCAKHFQSTSALVAHMESTRKCGIRGKYDFEKFLDEITGGFIKSKKVGEPKIFRQENALVKHGQSTKGIASTRFTAKEPRW